MKPKIFKRGPNRSHQPQISLMQTYSQISASRRKFPCARLFAGFFACGVHRIFETRFTGLQQNWRLGSFGKFGKPSRLCIKISTSLKITTDKIFEEMQSFNWKFSGLLRPVWERIIN